MKILKILGIVSLSMYSLFAVAEFEEDVLLVMRDNTEMMRSTEEKVLVTMELINKRGKTREREMVYYMKGNTEEMRDSLVRFLSPADIKGTGLLTYEHKVGADDRWLYLPGLRRERRLASSDQQDSFMGSDFSYEDMTLIFIDDFKYKIIGEDTINGEPCWLVESLHSTEEGQKDSGYSKQIFYINKAHRYTMGVDYYNKKHDKFKQMRVTNVAYFDQVKKWRPTEQVMENLKTGHKTRLIYRDYQFNEAVPEDFLTIRELRNG